jgi:hypothetical protein
MGLTSVWLRPCACTDGLKLAGMCMCRRPVCRGGVQPVYEAAHGLLLRSGDGIWRLLSVQGSSLQVLPALLWFDGSTSIEDLIQLDYV